MSRFFAYCRVSTNEQTTDNQLREIAGAGYSISPQRAITEMRKAVQTHVLRLPVSYFDSTKTGILISRIMTDAEGVRNLVGTGIIQRHEQSGPHHPTNAATENRTRLSRQVRRDQPVHRIALGRHGAEFGG